MIRAPRGLRRFTAPLCRAAICALSAALFTAKTAAGADLPALCDAAAQDAARATGVPLPVLRAISLTETGRRRGKAIRPWPWTVNMEGKGYWFPTRDEAIAFVDQSHKSGARSFDLGCFQLNHRWHGAAFASFRDMFEPQANALYAARFLKDLRDELGDWTKAVGAYHSRTPEHAQRYIALFEKHRARLARTQTEPQGPAAPRPAAPPVDVRLTSGSPASPRVNHYPLLKGGDSAGLGSIVPMRAAGPALFASADPKG